MWWDAYTPKDRATCLAEFKDNERLGIANDGEPPVPDVDGEVLIPAPATPLPDNPIPYGVVDAFAHPEFSMREVLDEFPTDMAHLRPFLPDDVGDSIGESQALCCRQGIAGLFTDPEAAIAGDNFAVASTYIASPATSVYTDDEDLEASDIAPWDAFEDECLLESEFCESQEVHNPSSTPSWTKVPAMPCTQVTRVALNSENIPACIAPSCLYEEAKHREMLAQRIYPINACVARPVPKSEIARTPGAKTSLDVERKRA